MASALLYDHENNFFFPVVEQKQMVAHQGNMSHYMEAGPAKR